MHQETSVTGLTMTGVAMGTPAHMSRVNASSGGRPRNRWATRCERPAGRTPLPKEATLWVMIAIGVATTACCFLGLLMRG